MAATAIDLQPHASLNDEDCESHIVRANVVNGISVPADVVDHARIAVQRMFDI